MEKWHIPSIPASGQRDPKVLFSTPECRAVVLDLQAGDELGEHSVRERATIQVVSGEVDVRSAGNSTTAREGTIITFEPNERHAVSARSQARLLLMLAPWPGEGHYASDEAADPYSGPARATVPPSD